MPVKDVYGKKVSEQNHMILVSQPYFYVIK